MEFNDQNFEEEVEKNEELSFVDFFAPWCGPCKMMGPIIEELENEYKDKAIKIGKLNVDENQTRAEKHQVMGVPTMILFKGKEVLEKMVGYKSKEELKDLFDKHLKA